MIGLLWRKIFFAFLKTEEIQKMLKIKRKQEYELVLESKKPFDIYDDIAGIHNSNLMNSLGTNYVCKCTIIVFVVVLEPIMMLIGLPLHYILGYLFIGHEKAHCQVRGGKFVI